MFISAAFQRIVWMRMFHATLKKIAASDASHLCIAYGLTLMTVLIGSSVFFDHFLGIPHLDILNYSASPMEWLLLVLCICAYLNPPRTIPSKLLQERIRWFEHAALLLFVGTVILALRITHPSDAMFHAMTNFIAQNQRTGGPLVAAFVAFVTVLPFFPAYAFIAPMTVLEKRYELLGILATLTVCFLITVIEAVYFPLISHVIMRLLSNILLMVSWNVYMNLQYNIISIEGFRVVIGAACAGLGYILLFLFFFAYLVFTLSATQKMSSLRSMIALLCGIVMVFFLNILRIVTLMLVGIRFPDFALILFHSAIGSIYFFLFFLLYFFFLRRWIGSPKTADYIDS